MRSQLLSRVPTLGEEVSLPGAGNTGTVARVVWTEDARVLVELAPGAVTGDFLDKLRTAGWAVVPREDPDAWLAAILGSS